MRVINELILKRTTSMGNVSREGEVLASDIRMTAQSLKAYKKSKKNCGIDDHLRCSRRLKKQREGTKSRFN